MTCIIRAAGQYATVARIVFTFHTSAYETSYIIIQNAFSTVIHGCYIRFRFMF